MATGSRILECMMTKCFVRGVAKEFLERQISEFPDFLRERVVKYALIP